MVTRTAAATAVVAVAATDFLKREERGDRGEFFFAFSAPSALIK